jgi:hypothetical protein
MSAAILDLPVLGDDAARIIAELVVAENIAAVAGEAALRPPPLLEVLPAVARLVRRVLPAPASAAPSASPLLQQPPVGIELHAFWPAPSNLWMLGTVMYIACHGDVHHYVGRLCCY